MPLIQANRYHARIPAHFIVDEAMPLPVLVTNLSRGGCRVEPTPPFGAGTAFRLEVAGWPRLAGRVVWSDQRRTGCIFDPRPAEGVWTMMLDRTSGEERTEG